MGKCVLNHYRYFCMDICNSLYSCKKMQPCWKKWLVWKELWNQRGNQKWLWWYVYADGKILITAIQVNLCWFLVKLVWGNTLLKFCHQHIPSQPVFGCPFDFTTLFTLAIFFNRAASFYDYIGCCKYPYKNINSGLIHTYLFLDVFFHTLYTFFGFHALLSIVN